MAAILARLTSVFGLGVLIWPPDWKIEGLLTCSIMLEDDLPWSRTIFVSFVSYCWYFGKSTAYSTLDLFGWFLREFTTLVEVEISGSETIFLLRDIWFGVCTWS